MPEEMTKNLSLMVDIETNLEQITEQFRKSGAGIEAQFQATKTEAEKIGIDLVQLMSIQMTKAMHQIGASIERLTKTIEDMMGKLAPGMQAAASQMTDSIKTTEASTVGSMERTKGAIEDTYDELIKKQKKANEEMDKSLEGPDASIKKVGEQFDEKKKDSLRKQYKDFSKDLEKGAEQFKGLGKAGKDAGGLVSKIFGTTNEATARSVKGTGLLRTATTNLGKSTFGAFKIGAQGARLFQAALGPIGWILLAIQAAIFAVKAAWKLLVGFVKAQVKLVVVMFKTVVNSIKLMGETMWMVIKGPLAALGKAVKWIIAALGGLSFVDAIKGAIELEDAANRIARTMVGGTQDIGDFHRAQSKLMADIKKSAWEAGASIEDMAAVYEGLAAYHIPVKDLKGLADMSFMAAKGLGLGRDAATQLVAELKHVGRLSGREIKGILNQFATLQQYVGLSAAETQALAKGIIETTRRLKSMGATAALITRYAKETNKLAAMFVKVGLDAQEAANWVSRLFDPDQLENNIVLYSKLGMSIDQAMAIMQGAGEIPADMAGKFVDIAKQVTAMGPIAGKAYAETMGMSYKMAQQLGSLTRDQVEEVNRVMGKGGDEAGKQLEEQRKKQQETLKEQLEMTRNKMAIMWMETLAPMLNFLKEALGAIQQIMADLMPVVKVISSFIGSIMGQMTKLIKPMTDMVTMVADVFLAKESPLFAAIEKIITTVAGIIQGLIPIVEDILGIIGEVAFEIIGSVLEVIGSVMESLEPAIKVMAVFFRNVIKPVAAIFSAVLDEMEPVFAMVARIAGNILRIFSKILINLLDKMAKPIKKIVGAISKILISLEEPINLILTVFGDVFMHSIIPAIMKLAEAVSDIFEKLRPTIEKLANVLANLFAKTITKFAEFFDNFVKNLEASGFFDKLPDILTKLMTLLVKFIELKMETLMTKVSSALETFSKSGFKLMDKGFKLLDTVLKFLTWWQRRKRARIAWRIESKKKGTAWAMTTNRFVWMADEMEKYAKEGLSRAAGGGPGDMWAAARAAHEKKEGAQETISEELGALTGETKKEAITTEMLSKVDQETMEDTRDAMRDNVDATNKLNEQIGGLLVTNAEIAAEATLYFPFLKDIALNTGTSAANS